MCVSLIYLSMPAVFSHYCEQRNVCVLNLSGEGDGALDLVGADVAGAFGVDL